MKIIKYVWRYKESLKVLCGSTVKFYVFVRKVTVLPGQIQLLESIRTQYW